MVEVAVEMPDKVAGEIERALKLSKCWMCSHAKADERMVTPELAHQDTNGSEFRTAFSS